MTHPTATSVKIFVPTKNFTQSLAFYQAIGWQLDWQNDDLAQLTFAGTSIFLQNHYNKQWAENFMLYIDVADAQAWYEFVKAVIDTGDHGKARIKPPEHQSHGAAVTYVWDPCGVLLHFAQPD